MRVSAPKALGEARARWYRFGMSRSTIRPRRRSGRFALGLVIISATLLVNSEGRAQGHRPPSVAVCKVTGPNDNVKLEGKVPTFVTPWKLDVEVGASFSDSRLVLSKSGTAPRTIGRFREGVPFLTKTTRVGASPLTIGSPHRGLGPIVDPDGTGFYGGEQGYPGPYDLDGDGNPDWVVRITLVEGGGVNVDSYAHVVSLRGDQVVVSPAIERPDAFVHGGGPGLIVDKDEQALEIRSYRLTREGLCVETSTDPALAAARKANVVMRLPKSIPKPYDYGHPEANRPLVEHCDLDGDGKPEPFEVGWMPWEEGANLVVTLPDQALTAMIPSAGALSILESSHGGHRDLLLGRELYWWRCEGAKKCSYERVTPEFLAGERAAKPKATAK